MKIEKIEDLQTLLDRPKKVVIIPHTNPDGDAIGSTLGWMQFLQQLGHQAEVISPNQYPDFLKWIPGTPSATIFEEDKGKAEDKIANADLIFTLDFNTLRRIGDMGDRVAQSHAKKIIIDHHQEPSLKIRTS